MCSKTKGNFFFLSLLDEGKVQPVQQLHYKLRQILDLKICYCKKCNKLPKLVTWNVKWNQLSTFHADKEDIYNGWAADDPSNIKLTSFSSLYICCNLSANSNSIHPGYCYVCKVRFEDYIIHSKSKLHKQIIYFNQFNQHIKKMCFMMRKSLKVQKPTKRKGQFAKRNGWNKRYRFMQTNPMFKKLDKAK